MVAERERVVGVTDIILKDPGMNLLGDRLAGSELQHAGSFLRRARDTREGIMLSVFRPRAGWVALSQAELVAVSYGPLLNPLHPSIQTQVAAISQSPSTFLTQDALPR